MRLNNLPFLCMDKYCYVHDIEAQAYRVNVISPNVPLLTEFLLDAGAKISLHCLSYPYFRLQLYRANREKQTHGSHSMTESKSNVLLLYASVIFNCNFS